MMAAIENADAFVDIFSPVGEEFRSTSSCIIFLLQILLHFYLNSKFNDLQENFPLNLEIYPYTCK